MFRTITRITTPIIAGTIAFGVFPLKKSQWKSAHDNDNPEILEKIKQSTLFKQLEGNKAFIQHSARNEFPNQHHKNLVTAGLLYGKDMFETSPIIFSDGKQKFYAFYHIGNKLVSEDGKVHNGIVSTIMDEGLCGAGFPLLPSKKGVTAKLSIDFKNQAPPNSIVVLKANVADHKGRKVVIHGSLETLNDNPITIANGDCVLVEPKWFKYFSWLLFI